MTKEFASENEYLMPLELVKMFHQVVPEDCGSTRSFAEINETAAKRGFLVVPEACNQLVELFLSDVRLDPNATFYKEWDDIRKRTSIELFMDQITHYMSTYGTNFSHGNGYVPNDGERPLMSYDKLTVITAVTADEMKARCVDMLKSGIAMKPATVNALVDFVLHHGGCDISEVKNKEAACIMYARTDKRPPDPVEYVRLLVYMYTNETLLIKSRDVIKSIRNMYGTPGADAFASMSDQDIDLLARVFYRFKPLFLAMKHQAKEREGNYDYDESKRIAHVINRIRSRARKLKTPFKPGVLDTVCIPGDTGKLEKISDEIETVPMFRRLRLLQCVEDRLNFRPGQWAVYVIRNGKSFIREDYSPKIDIGWLDYVKTILTESIRKFVESRKKTGKVRLPDNCELAMPTSEKNFIGDYPMGTTVPLHEHNVVGVYWRNEWGTRDFDLSMADTEGNMVSWTSGFSSGDFMHSGDMTNAEPEASECVYFPTGASDGMMVNLNQFNGSDPAGKYRFFFGSYDGKPKFSHGFMVEPKDLVFSLDGNLPCKQVTLAVMGKASAVLLGLGTGNKSVSFANGMASTIGMLSDKFAKVIRLRALLLMAGFEIVPTDYEGEVDLDLREMSRDSLVKFFSQEEA